MLLREAPCGCTRAGVHTRKKGCRSGERRYTYHVYIIREFDVSVRGEAEKCYRGQGN